MKPWREPQGRARHVLQRRTPAAACAGAVSASWAKALIELPAASGYICLTRNYRRRVEKYMPLTELENDLRDCARELIATGALPAQHPVNVWGGNGNGKLCSLCRSVIAREDVQYEMETAAAIYRFHSMCHAAWLFECSRVEHIALAVPSDGESKEGR